MTQIPPEIFKAYDIRGIVGRSLTPQVVELVGRAVGTEALTLGLKEIVVGRDGRLSGPELSAALCRGLQSTGVDVLDIGLVTTPMTYFAAYELGTHAAVMVTGSHNPVDYNGLKIVLADMALSGEAIQGLRQRIERLDFVTGTGACREHDISQAYLDRILADIRLARPMRVAIDCGNGAAGGIAPRLFRALGCEVDELYCQVDGHFPNHHPDPSQPKNLRDLVASVTTGSAEVGLAFDGDGDRLGVVTGDGRIIYPDRQLMLFAADILARNPGATVVYDVKCTRNLSPWIEARGGHPMMWKSGHSMIKAKMRETGALLGGEMSGHIFIKERWFGFDDGLYAGARLLEILSRETTLHEAFEKVPDSFSTPELHISMPEGEAHRLVASLGTNALFQSASHVITIDGLRVEFADGFGLLRASNTTPDLVLRFEADTPNALSSIEETFRNLLRQANVVLPTLRLI